MQKLKNKNLSNKKKLTTKSLNNLAKIKNNLY